MNNNLSYYEKCLLYLRGEASKELQQEVLQAKESDPESLKIFEDTELLFKGFSVLDKHKKAKELFAKKPLFSISWRYASLVALLTIVGLFAYLGLSNTYFPKFETKTSVLMSPSQVNADESTTTPQEKAYQLFALGKGQYETQDFRAALSSFEKALEQPNLRNQLSEAIQWYQCVSYLRAEEVGKAKTILDNLEQLPNPKFKVARLTKMKIRFQLFLKNLF